MVRYEMINDLKKSREETLRLIHHISSGLIIIGDELFSSKDSSNANKFKEFSSTEFEFYDNFTELKLNEPSTSKDPNNNSTNMLNVKNCNPKRDNTANLDSLGSSSDTQSANSEPNTEIVQVNSSPSSETDSILNNLKPSPIIDLTNNKKLNVLTNSSIKELESVREESVKINGPEVNSNSIIIIEQMDQGVQTILNNDNEDDEINHNDKMYII